MKYILNRKEVNLEIIEFPTEVEGLEVSPQGNIEIPSIKIKNITLVDKKLVKSYVDQIISKKFEKLVKMMNKSLLDNTDESDEGAMQALDEIQKLKSRIVNKYKIHLTEKQYKDFLKKLLMMEEEFKMRYNQKIIYRQMTHMNEEHRNISR
jgi:uncharacterized UPF0160 family protein